LVAALLYDGELVESVPALPHDRPVGAVVTPSGVHRFDARG
ncbi:5-formyltetrahydrofolate cyclo-ligase, partial [Carbonactinospora thermoautotrophica]